MLARTVAVAEALAALVALSVAVRHWQYGSTAVQLAMWQWLYGSTAVSAASRQWQYGSTTVALTVVSLALVASLRWANVLPTLQCTKKIWPEFVFNVLKAMRSPLPWHGCRKCCSFWAKSTMS